MKLFDLSGKTALVTGAKRGIGRGMTEALAAAGADIIGVSASLEAEGSAVEQAVTAYGRHFTGYRCDFSDRTALNNFIEQVHSAGIVPDILVNNAGGSTGFAPIHELGEEAWQEANHWILNSCFWATRRAIPDMLSRNWGRIINISSVEGAQANKKNVSHYITFKHAMNGFTKAAAFEYGDLGITVNAISPGAIETDLMMEAGPDAAASMGVTYEEFKDTYAQESAIKRLNTVEEVASLALYLVSEQAGGMTGAILPVDGGTSL